MEAALGAERPGVVDRPPHAGGVSRRVWPPDANGERATEGDGLNALIAVFLMTSATERNKYRCVSLVCCSDECGHDKLGENGPIGKWLAWVDREISRSSGALSLDYSNIWAPTYPFVDDRPLCDPPP